MSTFLSYAIEFPGCLTLHTGAAYGVLDMIKARPVKWDGFGDVETSMVDATERIEAGERVAFLVVNEDFPRGERAIFVSKRKEPKS